MWRALGGLVTCGVLAAASGLFGVALLVGRERERKHLAHLRQINAELEARVEARTAELTASEASFRLLAEYASDMVVRIGPDGTRRYVSPASARIVGWAPEALVDHHPREIVHPDDTATLEAFETRLLTGTVENDTVSLRVLHPDRGEVWVEAGARPLRDPDTGAPDGYVSVLRDVTERRKVKEALKASEARYRLLAETTTDLITCLDLNLRRTYASPACRTIVGYEPEELLGAAPADMMHPHDREDTRRRLRLLASGEIERDCSTYRLRHRQGCWVWLEVNFALVRDEDTGQPASIVCSARDISERKAQADEVRAAKTALERLTRHLAQARDRAEQASRAKTRFLAGLSHELRTPLNGILGYAQLLRLEGGLSTSQAGRVEAMLGAGRHLLEMINRVLDLSEIEAEHVELRAVQFDLRSVAGTCLGLVRPAAEAKTLALGLMVAPDLPQQVTADATRLRQVLLNLLGNAVKFTARGSVELRLRSVADGATLRIEVADTGPGIPAEQRQRLFHDFERLDIEATSTVEGAGLGLSLSARLAALMGGRLGHEDNPGGGCVFWLELPMVAAAEPAAPATTTPDVSAAQPASAPARALRVLVVDDAAMNRDIAGSFLHAAGHEVAYAEGGAEAIEIVAAADFDVVLMDVRMPKVDGLEATRHIRTLEGTRGRVPIVALTAQAFAEQVEECLRAGMDGHLAKPFTPDALLDAAMRAAVAGQARGKAEASPRVAAASGERASSVVMPTTVPAASAIAAIGSELPVLDPRAFGRTAGFLAPEAVASYLRTLIKRGEALLHGLRAPDPLARPGDNLAAAAHALAGSAGMFGFERLAAVARGFEHAVQNPSPEIQVTVESLIAAIEASLQEMQRRVPIVAASPPEGGSRELADTRV